ncbi:serine/threonine-protein kinase [Spirulina major CS-329]|uniref:serine/threonine-protein kinase n=1 Tax=Spirulina TaxID=1154 RepID=UPI00232B9190|nr:MULTISPECIES: serine/threonine-protein kinase [Spirulina]MDB9494716.1 serine/threonine-protein kinase [Spirulina subsalsa CS-330]MDB9502746.1 serine/threonine-protein kinase [Spirulina major CS-329]
MLSNRYRLVRPLGQGGFGATYLAEDQQMPSQRRCVVKQLQPQTTNSQDIQLIQNRFGREATILEEVGKGHAQIPDLYAFFVEAGQFYLVQEWIEGVTLLAHVQQQGVWPDSRVRSLLTSLLPVLSYIHNKGVIHRDIKPDNIMLRASDQTPILIDFGAVRETMGTALNSAGKSTSSIIIGTPGFMPQEQAVGRPVFSSDLFGLGLTAVFLLTGKYPMELVTDPMTGEIIWREFAPLVSPTLADIIDMAIRSHSRDRFNTATAMLTALQGSGIPPTSMSVPPSTIASPTPVGFNPQHSTVVVAPGPVSTATPTSTPNSGGFSDWQKMIITGSVMGVFVLGAIAIAQLPQRNTDEPDKTTETTPEPSTPSTQSSPDIPTTSTNSTPNSPPTATPQQPTIVVQPDPPQPAPPIIERPSPAKFIREHYTLLNQRQYDTTYQRLSSNFQSKSNGYAEYVNWWNKVARINIGAVQTLEANANEAVVNAELQYIMKAGKPFNDDKSRIYLTWNEAQQSWLINDKTAP